MMTMVMYAKIRRMHFREHLTISEIQRRTTLSRNTINKWLRGGEEPRNPHRNRDSKLRPFEPALSSRWKPMPTVPSEIAARQSGCLRRSGRRVTRAAIRKSPILSSAVANTR